MQVEFGILQRWLVGGIHYKGSAMFLIRIQGNHIWASSGRTYLYQLCSFPAQCICLQMVLELFCMICSSVITFLTSYCVLVQSLILWNKLFAPTFLLSLLSSAWLPLAERRFEHQVEWRFLCPQVSLCFWCDYIRNILSQWCHTEAGVDGGRLHVAQNKTKHIRSWIAHGSLHSAEDHWERDCDVTHQSLVFAHIRLLHVAYFLIIRKTIKGTNPNAGSCFSSSTRTRTYSHVIWHQCFSHTQEHRPSNGILKIAFCYAA